MNKRIRKLAKQAGLSYMPSKYPDMADLYQGADFELEKFAELIVRECAKIADDGCGSACFGLGINGAMLLEHFGVE